MGQRLKRRRALHVQNDIVHVPPIVRAQLVEVGPDVYKKTRKAMD